MEQEFIVKCNIGKRLKGEFTVYAIFDDTENGWWLYCDVPILKRMGVYLDNKTLVNEGIDSAISYIENMMKNEMCIEVKLKVKK